MTTESAIESLLNLFGFAPFSRLNARRAGLEDAIRPDLAIGFVGPFRPNTHRNLGHARGVRPAQYAGYTSPIPANHDTGPAPKAAPKKDAPKPAAANRAWGHVPPARAQRRRPSCRPLPLF